MIAQHKQIAAGVLVLAGILSTLTGSDPAPTPAPQPPDGLVLRGLFIGPTAAEDAQIIAAYCEELAGEIQWDGMQPEPMLRTGIAFDELRTRARALRMRGVSIGERQPRVRAAVEQFLIDAVGVSGGPLSAEARSQWVASYREIGRAAADVAR